MEFLSLLKQTRSTAMFSYFTYILYVPSGRQHLFHLRTMIEISHAGVNLARRRNQRGCSSVSMFLHRENPVLHILLSVVLWLILWIWSEIVDSHSIDEPHVDSIRARASPSFAQVERVEVEQFLEWMAPQRMGRLVGPPSMLFDRQEVRVDVEAVPTEHSPAGDRLPVSFDVPFLRCVARLLFVYSFQLFSISVSSTHSLRSQ